MSGKLHLTVPVTVKITWNNQFTFTLLMSQVRGEKLLLQGSGMSLWSEPPSKVSAESDHQTEMYG